MRSVEAFVLKSRITHSESSARTRNALRRNLTRRARAAIQAAAKTLYTRASPRQNRRPAAVPLTPSALRASPPLGNRFNLSGLLIAVRIRTLAARLHLWHTGSFSSVRQFRAARPPRVGIVRPNGSAFRSQLLHHRAHRPRKIHSGRSLARAYWRAYPARNDRPGSRFDGPRARARHHHQGQEHSPALPRERRPRIPAQLD